MKTPVFKGSCTAMITPFTKEGIDYRRVGELLDFQEKNGTDAILLAGTTGENPTLEIHERNELVDFSIRYAAGRMKMIVGIGGNNTKACLENALTAQRSGADAVLMTTPYYNKSTQAGLVEHFCSVADKIEIPLIVYNVPHRTSVSITMDTYRLLAKHPNINGVKEASGDFSLIAKTMAKCGDSLYFWSGNDDNTIPMMALGGLGVISVASNIVPEMMSMTAKLCLSGDFAAASALNRRYSSLLDVLFIETNPMPLKAAMELMHLDSGLLRLPLVKISDPSLEKLKSVMRELKLIS